MICLKTRTFAVSQTTALSTSSTNSTLWFAWKLVLLQYRKQLNHREPNHHSSCDLLENSYFCSIANNPRIRKNDENGVVICLKTRTFAVSQTTRTSHVVLSCQLWFAWKLVLLQYRKQLAKSPCVCHFVLWFAWKLVLLQYRKQPKFTQLIKKNGCDLLENSYFCSIANNVSYFNEKRTLLWFAWKLVLLQYRKQQWN